jgi:hypothetical protein
MSSIEERLVRDIATVTGGVIVTESDLKEARDAINARFDADRRHVSLRRFAPAAAAAIVLALVGATAYLTLGGDDHASQPANGGSSTSDDDYLTGSLPTTQLLNGVWRLDNGSVQVKFGADGTVRFDEHGMLFSHPSTTGSYAVTGQLITVTLAAHPQSTCVGTTLQIRASLPEAGLLRFLPDAASASCSPLGPGKGAFEQLLPTNNKNLSTLVFSTDKAWTALPSKDDLYGIWLAERTGFLLEMDRGGAYFVVDASGATIDKGQWSLSGTDLTLTSGPGSQACTAGDKLVLGAVQWEDPGTAALRGTVRQNTCHAAWTPPAWILVPNADS